MSGPTHQHFVPKFLQRNFLTKGQEMLWLYDCGNNRFMELHPTNIAVKKNLYTLKSPHLHDQRYAVENALAILEGKASSALAKIRRHRDISQEERNAISECAGFQMVRTLAFMDRIKGWMDTSPKYIIDAFGKELAELSPKDFAKKIAAFEASKELKSGLTQDDFRRGNLSDSVRMTAPPDSEHEMAVTVGTELAIIFSKRKWLVIHAPKGKGFICSDRPVVQMPTLPAETIFDYGPGSPYVDNFFPFANDAALLITTEELPSIQHVGIAAQPLKQFNKLTAMNSKQFIFSHSKALLQAQVTKYSLANRDLNVEKLQSDALLRELVKRSFAKDKLHQ